MTNQDKTKDRKQYDAIVKGLGKFEGEAAYVPYFYNMSLCDGFGDVTEFGAYCFLIDVEATDIAIFSELADKKTVYLMENSQGFVSEISKVEYETLENEYEAFMENQTSNEME